MSYGKLGSAPALRIWLVTFSIRQMGMKKRYRWAVGKSAYDTEEKAVAAARFMNASEHYKGASVEVLYVN